MQAIRNESSNHFDKHTYPSVIQPNSRLHQAAHTCVGGCWHCLGKGDRHGSQEGRHRCSEPPHHHPPDSRILLSPQGQWHCWRRQGHVAACQRGDRQAARSVAPSFLLASYSHRQSFGQHTLSRLCFADIAIILSVGHLCHRKVYWGQMKSIGCRVECRGVAEAIGESAQKT